MARINIKNPKLNVLIRKSLKKLGENNFRSLLEGATIGKTNNDNILTIMVNEGLHKVPARFIHGELYIASKGNLVFSSPSLIIRQYRNILSKLRSKLSEKNWKRVYLIPTGHPTISLQIKNLVYHVLRLDTIDLFYSDGKYFELDIRRASYLKERFH